MSVEQRADGRSAAPFAFLVQLDREMEPGCEAMAAVAQDHSVVPVMSPVLHERDCAHDREHDPGREIGRRDFAMSRIFRGHSSGRQTVRTAVPRRRSRFHFGAGTRLPQHKSLLAHIHNLRTRRLGDLGLRRIETHRTDCPTAHAENDIRVSMNAPARVQDAHRSDGCRSRGQYGCRKATRRDRSGEIALRRGKR